MARKKGGRKKPPGTQQGMGAKHAMKHIHQTVQKRMRGR